MIFRRFFDKGVDFTSKLSTAKWLNDLNLMLDDIVGGYNNTFIGLPVYANNAAAVAGGLKAGQIYRTGGDPDLVAVVH